MALLPFLSSRGVLGLNARNLLYLKPFNPRKAVAFADDKLKTKLFLSTRGVPVPKVYATVESRAKLRAFSFSGLPEEFVLKPNFGYGGEGIIIVTGRRNGGFVTKGKVVLSEKDLFDHIEDILEGKFSVNGRPDIAFFEELLVPHKCFAPFRPAGLPDIRVVCFNLVPVMAMLRIPTAESHGKANMHLGGIGIGIDLNRGATTFAAQRNALIESLPHGEDFRGIKIPHWDEILLITSRIQYVTNIGYLAADITIDETGGPKLLEVNARAGLSVQIANLAPLRARLERVAGLKVASPEKGVLLGKELFGSSAARPTAAPAATPTIGLKDAIAIPLEDGGNIEIGAVVSTEHERTAFAPDLVRELVGRGALETENEDESTYRVRFALAGKKIQTIVVARELEGDARVSLGRRDIKGFLIDPEKNAVRAAKKAKITVDLWATDRQIAQIAREMPFLKALKPMNLQNHLTAAQEDAEYQPQFSYESLAIDGDDVRTRLHELRFDASPFGTLLKKKRDELLLRLDVLESRGDNQAFTAASIALLGKPSKSLLSDAHRSLAERETCVIPVRKSELLSAVKVKERFEKILTLYALHEWVVEIRDNLVSDCAVGGRKVMLRKGALFEPAHVSALIAHEIEAHVLTAENAASQPYHLLRIGCAEYLDTQEGLAVVLQNRVLPAGHDKRYWPARNALGVAYALEHDFASTRRELERIGFSPEKALRKAFSLKRGMGDTSRPGAFTKDLAYFRGELLVERFLQDDGDLRRLYIGRVALPDLAAIEKLPGLRRPFLIPRFLRDA